MKLYFSKGACSLVPRIIINELGLDCEFESVNLKTKKTETDKDYFSINPKGYVPALELQNGEVLTENAVILQYLCDTSHAIQLLPSPSDFKRYHVLEWLQFISTELHKSIGTLFNQDITSDVKESVFIPLIKKKLVYVNQHLQNRSYLLGDHFTVPDAYLFIILYWADHLKLDLNNWKYLKSFFEKLNQRDAIIKSLKQEGLKGIDHAD